MCLGKKFSDLVLFLFITCFMIAHIFKDKTFNGGGGGGGGDINFLNLLVRFKTQF